MIALNDIVELCRAQSLAHKLFPTEEADWRWFCREYSRSFHTPLHLVFEMSPEHVILCVLEDGLDAKKLFKREDADRIIEELRRVEDPEYDAKREAELDDFAAGIEEWDAQRIAENRPIPVREGKSNEQKLAEEANKNAMDTSPDKPRKEGFIDLSYLENSSDER